SPLAINGCLYIAEERGGVAGCYDSKTGKRHYRTRIPSAGGFVASPWCCGDRIYFLDDSGTTHILKSGPEFKVLGASSLDEMTWSSPAMTGGSIYLRTVEQLYCIRDAKH